MKVKIIKNKKYAADVEIGDIYKVVGYNLDKKKEELYFELLIRKSSNYTQSVHPKEVEIIL